MTLLQKFFPPEANNEFRGNKVALYGLILFTVLMTGRSLVHFLFDDGGTNVIANIIVFEGNPDPNRVIYLFASLWGMQQLIFCFVNIVVLARYRTLIPLMYLLWIFEWLTRLLVVPMMHGLGPEYTDGLTPGAQGAPFVVILLIVLLLLSLKTKQGAAQ